MKEKLFLYIFLCIIYYSAHSQDIGYARYLIDTLSSPAFSGRGYENGNDRKTAEFIARELQKNKIKKIEKTYFQQLPISSNTFSNEYQLELENIDLNPGKDFYFTSNSCSLKGKFSVFKLNAQFLRDSLYPNSLSKIDFSNTFVLLDTVGLGVEDFKKINKPIFKDNILKCKGIIEPVAVLPPYYPTAESHNFVHALCLRSALPDTMKFLNINLKNKEQKDYLSKNVAGIRKGEIDSFIVFTAHYDHLGQIGTKTYFPGANDNASGVAILLNLAQYYAKTKKKPKYTIAFIFFTGEELGLLGSKYFSENPMFQLSKIKFLINLDMVGSGDKGIQIVNSTVFKKEFALIDNINSEKKYLPQIKKRGAAANSDHYFFYEKGVKSFFIYTLGEYKEYHNINDKAENLPLSEYEDLFRLLTEFVEKI